MECRSRSRSRSSGFSASLKRLSRRPVVLRDGCSIKCTVTSCDHYPRLRQCWTCEGSSWDQERRISTFPSRQYDNSIGQGSDPIKFVLLFIKCAAREEDENSRME